MNSHLFAHLVWVFAYLFWVFGVISTFHIMLKRRVGIGNFTLGDLFITLVTAFIWPIALIIFLIIFSNEIVLIKSNVKNGRRLD